MATWKLNVQTISAKLSNLQAQQLRQPQSLSPSRQTEGAEIWKRHLQQKDQENAHLRAEIRNLKTQVQ